MSNQVVMILMERSGGTKAQPLYREQFAFTPPEDLALPSSLFFMKEDIVQASLVPPGEDREVFLLPSALQFKEPALKLGEHLSKHDLCVKGSVGMHILLVREKSDGRILMKLRIEPKVERLSVRQQAREIAPQPQGRESAPTLSAPAGMQSFGAGKREREDILAEKKRLKPHEREGWREGGGGGGGGGDSGGGIAGGGGGGNVAPPPPPSHFVVLKGSLGKPLTNIVANFVQVVQNKVRMALLMGKGGAGSGAEGDSEGGALQPDFL
jgi:hypothetical protein